MRNRISNSTRIIDMVEDDLIRIIKDVVNDSLKDFQNQSNDERKYIDTIEAQEFLNVSYSTLKVWRKSGKIPYIKIGAKVYFDKAEIVSHLDTKYRRNT